MLTNELSSEEIRMAELELTMQCNHLENIHAIQSRLRVIRNDEILLPPVEGLLKYLCCDKGKIAVIGGRPGMGKTGLMLSVIDENPNNSFLIFTVELNFKQLLRRFKKMSIGETVIKMNEIEQVHQIDDVNTICSFGNMFISDKSKPDIDDFRKIIECQRINYHIDALFIDYFQLINSGTELLYWLKIWAEKYSFTVIILSQLSREVDFNPMDLPGFNSFKGLSNPELIDQYYYLLQPGHYLFTENLPGYYLEYTAELYCLKGEFMNKRLVFHFDAKECKFKKSRLSNLLNEKEGVF